FLPLVCVCVRTEARKARNVNGQQKITYNALGIEDDDASDEDYVLEAISEDDDLSSGKSNEGSITAAGKLLCGVYMHLGKPSAQSNKNKTIQGNVKPGMAVICVRVAYFSILQAHIFACC
ncbi:hypothetical protein GN958_ATG00653, partial [Phytophthora infestans]